MVLGMCILVFLICFHGVQNSENVAYQPLLPHGEIRLRNVNEKLYFSMVLNNTDIGIVTLNQFELKYTAIDACIYRDKKKGEKGDCLYRIVGYNPFFLPALAVGEEEPLDYYMCLQFSEYPINDLFISWKTEDPFYRLLTLNQTERLYFTFRNEHRYYMFDMPENSYGSVVIQEIHSDEGYKGRYGARAYTRFGLPASEDYYDYRSEKQSEFSFVSIPAIYSKKKKTWYLIVKYVDFIASGYDITLNYQPIPENTLLLPYSNSIKDMREGKYFKINVKKGQNLRVKSSGTSLLQIDRPPTPSDYLMIKNISEPHMTDTLEYTAKTDELLYVLVLPSFESKYNHIQIFIGKLTVQVIVILSVFGMIFTIASTYFVIILVKHQFQRIKSEMVSNSEKGLNTINYESDGSALSEEETHLIFDE